MNESSVPLCNAHEQVLGTIVHSSPTTPWYHCDAIVNYTSVLIIRFCTTKRRREQLSCEAIFDHFWVPKPYVQLHRFEGQLYTPFWDGFITLLVFNLAVFDYLSVSKSLCTPTSCWRLAAHTILESLYHPFQCPNGFISGQKRHLKYIQLQMGSDQSNLDEAQASSRL